MDKYDLKLIVSSDYNQKQIKNPPQADFGPPVLIRYRELQKESSL